MNKEELSHIPSKSFIAASSTFYIDSTMIQVWGKGISVKDYESDTEHFIPWDQLINHIKTNGSIIEGRL